MKNILFLILLLLIISCSNKNNGILPEKRPLTESVYSSVTIQPDSLYQVYAAVGGILDENLVKEGDMVLKDEPLLQIINNTPKLNAQNAKFALDLAKENYYGSAAILGGILDQINAAKLKYKNDSINYFRQKNLWEQNIGSKIDYDNKKLNYELSQNNLLTLQNNYERTKNQLETTLKQSENNYISALNNTKDFTVKSKIKGKVYAIYKEPGEIVNIQEPIASVGSANNFVIDMLIDEVDIVNIKLNQEVLIKLDAYNQDIFKGRISKIYPKKDEHNQTFKVEAIFENPPEVLYPGLSGEGNIITTKKDSVLTIPKDFIVNGHQVKTKAGLTTITLGLQNMEYAEVLDGITKDTYIFKPE